MILLAFLLSSSGLAGFMKREKCGVSATESLFKQQGYEIQIQST